MIPFIYSKSFIKANPLRELEALKQSQQQSNFKTARSPTKAGSMLTFSKTEKSPKQNKMNETQPLLDQGRTSLYNSGMKTLRHNYNSINQNSGDVMMQTQSSVKMMFALAATAGNTFAVNGQSAMNLTNNDKGL
jgi:hypothetical protein